MQIAIPPQDTKQFTKPSKGEVYGNIWATKNIDFGSNRGKIRLSERLYSLFNDTAGATGDADMEVPVKFIRTNADGTDRWWSLVQAGASSVSDGLLFKTTDTDPLVGWTQDAIASSPTDCVDDMEIFGQVTTDRLVVARDTDLAMLQNGTWDASWWDTTLVQAALTATNPHPLHQFINLLILADGNLVHTIDDSLVVVASRITLPKEYQIMWIEDDGTRVYFGTRHIRGGEALVFPWNGTDETYDTPIPVKDSISLAGVASSAGVMHTLNGKGQLMGYNGQGFEEVAALPIADSKLRWQTTATLVRAQKVHANGMTLIDGRINILLMGQVDAGYLLENMNSGIWEYDEKVGLYHKYSISQYNGSTNNEWGISWLITAGALTETSQNKGRFLAGAEIWTAAEATKLEGIFTSQVASTVTQRGYFVTPQIQSTNVRAFWKRLNLAFKKFENSTDRIVAKYKTDKDKDLDNVGGSMNSIALTWTDTDTFTSTNGEVLAYAEAGDEVEITMGKGAGALAHIASISLVSTTYTVNLDETIPNVAGTAEARIQNWKKLGEISSQSIQKQLYKITKRAKWIQFKIELRGDHQSPELEELSLEFSNSKR